MSKKMKFPRVPLPRQTGGAHRVKRELSAREELTLRLNEMEAEGIEDDEEWAAEMRHLFADHDEDDYFDDLLGRLDERGGR
jgi:hypothetical protein